MYLGSTSRFSSDNNGSFGINYGTTGGTATGSLVIYNNTTATSQLNRNGTIASNINGNNIVGGNIVLGPSSGSSKWYAITGRQYDSSTETEGYSLITGATSSGVNNVTIGGGLDEQNAATTVNIKVAANSTTRNGTEVVRVTTSGLDVRNNVLRITGTTVIDASRNITAGTISSADHTIISGTSGTNTTGLVFKTTDNVDAQAYIKKSAYYMHYNSNQNEGHHFTYSGTQSLLRLHGGNNGTRPHSVDITADNGLYMNNVQVIDASRNITAGSITAGNFTPSGYISQGTGQSHYFRGGTDANWRIGSDITVDTGGLVNSAAIQMIVGGGSSPNYGFQIFGHTTPTVPVFEVLPQVNAASSITNIRGKLYINNTEVIDNSRNLKNIGTISSGAITSTGTMTLSADTTQVINLSAASTNNSRGISFNGKVALSASQDGWLRLNQNSQFTNGVYTPLGLRADGGVDSYTGYKIIGTTVLDASRNINVVNITSTGTTTLQACNPAIDNTYDLGTSVLRWRNVYTTDLHLSNEGKPEGNEVDGTTGNWTIQEGEENLYILNNKTGKKYKFALEEIT